MTDGDLFKMQCCSTGILDGHSPVREMRVAFKISYLYDCTIKLCRTQVEVILNNVNPNVCGIGQGEAMFRKYNRLKLGGGHTYNCSAD
jgi:hypothetical protein